MLTIPDLTLLFMVIVSSLAVALVYMLHELEPKLARLRLRGNRVSHDPTKQPKRCRACRAVGRLLAVAGAARSVSGAGCSPETGIQRAKKQGRRRSIPSTTLPAPDIEIGSRHPVI